MEPHTIKLSWCGSFTNVKFHIYLYHEQPKLPRILEAEARQHRTKTFVFPTNHDLKREHRLTDATLLEHTPSNPYCTCELCRMNATVIGQIGQHRSQTSLTKTAVLQGYKRQTDVREIALSRQLQVGQRVMVRMKKSQFDLEPTELTGVVRYVGKIDSAYVDHRLYVGVKLDEAGMLNASCEFLSSHVNTFVSAALVAFNLCFVVGDMGGLIKNKRYFSCPPNHGILVRISNVVSILPDKVKYRN